MPSWSLNLDPPQPASDDCLPHAAMGLGSMRAVGTRPQQALVHRLVIQRQMQAWCLFRMDDGGGFVGETWHESKDAAFAEAKREFDVDSAAFTEMP
ncbi:MAG: hypothetical protein AAGK78_06420 [Planctomycetota bacterium]